MKNCLSSQLNNKHDVFNSIYLYLFTICMLFIKNTNILTLNSIFIYKCSILNIFLSTKYSIKLIIPKNCKIYSKKQIKDKKNNIWKFTQ